MSPIEALRARVGRYDRDDPEVDYDADGRPRCAIVRVTKGRARAYGIAWDSELQTGIARRNARTVLVLLAEERALGLMLGEVPR